MRCEESAETRTRQVRGGHPDDARAGRPGKLRTERCGTRRSRFQHPGEHCGNKKLGETEKRVLLLGCFGINLEVVGDPYGLWHGFALSQLRRAGGESFS